MRVKRRTRRQPSWPGAKLPWPPIRPVDAGRRRQPGKVLELERELDGQAQVTAGGIAAEQAADGPQAVGERVGMDVEPPRGLAGVVVGLDVGPERRDQRSAVFGVVAAERTQRVFDEVVPVLRSAAVEQDAVDAEVLEG